MKHLRIKTKLFQRAALTMLTLVMAFTAQTAWAWDGYDWWDGYMDIGGINTLFSSWPTDNATNLSSENYATSMTITSVSLKFWSNRNDRDGGDVKMHFRIWDGGGQQVGDDQTLNMGRPTRIENTNHDFTISWTGSMNLAEAVGLTLVPGKEYYIDMWLETNGSSSNSTEWYSGGENKNFKAKLTIDPDVPCVVKANYANGAYWSTFYSETGNYQAPSGTEVFAVHLDGTKLTMIPIDDRIVNSGKGVVLKQTTNESTPDATTTITLTKTTNNSSGDYSTNSLTGTTKQIKNSGDLAGDYYVLSGGDRGVGFYKLKSDGTIAGSKAYLIATVGAREFIGFDDDATRIEMPMVESSDADAVVYDLQGRRVAQPTKGLYIVNGKKVIIK